MTSLLWDGSDEFRGDQFGLMITYFVAKMDHHLPGEELMDAIHTELDCKTCPQFISGFKILLLFKQVIDLKTNIALIVHV